MRTSELYLIPAMTVMKQGVASAISCCTCATLLTEVPRLAESEKPFPSARQLDCCGRAICGCCIHVCHLHCRLRLRPTVMAGFTANLLQQIRSTLTRLGMGIVIGK